jgi:23S rRNA (uracil1939-C5)-methyltransferase
MPRIELDLDRVATGGAGLGVGPDGRVVFATGGLPGERVAVEIEREHATRLVGRVAEVLRPSPDRRLPACPHVARGCGGCDWQHVADGRQRQLRMDIVVDCLRRLGRLDAPDVRLGPRLDPNGFRTTVRAAVVGGRAGYRVARSHDVVTVDSCLIAHPLVEEILVEGRFGPAREVTVRVGAGTGDRLVVASPTADGVQVAPDVTVVGDDELRRGNPAHYHEEVAGRRLRISARSFFQCRADGAEALVDVALAALSPSPERARDDSARPHGAPTGERGQRRLLDAYCGVGLFGALAGPGWTVTGVESGRSSAGDAEVNYARHQPGATVVTGRLERWQPRAMTAVIADPARSGLGRRAAAVVAATGAPVVVLVSCDPASLARDTGLLTGHGYQLDHVTVLDLFAQTSHVETVTRFSRPEADNQSAIGATEPFADSIGRRSRRGRPAPPRPQRRSR